MNIYYEGIQELVSKFKEFDDICVINDVCSAYFIEGEWTKQLTLNDIILIFPYFEKLTNAKHESHFITGATCIYTILKHIQNDIIESRNPYALFNSDPQQGEKVK